ncbi:MAG: T9SS type A sorting domain-containing protein [Saprospiraceae bacterium]|nr:T9SS type A sorting domain-containing protein [Saprospiraceae bacterium]
MKHLFQTLLFLCVTAVLPAQNWTPMAQGILPAGYLIFSISAVEDHTIWAVASQAIFQPPVPSTHKPQLLRSADGGQTWTALEVEEAVGAISFRIVAIDSLTAYLTTQDYGSGSGLALYKTTDGGFNWNKEFSQSSTGVSLTRFPDGQHWLAHNRQFISRSANDGATWTDAMVSGYKTDEFQLLYSGTNMASAVGDTLWNGTSSGRMLRFTQYGQASQFFDTGLGTATAIYSVAFQDHLNGLCYSRNLANNNRIARSTDGGATWSVLAKQPGTTTGWCISAVPGTPGFYVLSTNFNTTLGKIAITKDFGESWTIQNINKPLNAVTFTSPTTGWVGTGEILEDTQPALYKYNGAPLVGTTAPDALPGFWVSPNPTSGLLRFGFDGLDKSSVTAMLSDAAGQTLFSGTLSTPQLDLSPFPAGLYFLTVQTENGQVTRQVIREE